MSTRATKIAQWSNRFERFQKSNISVTEFCHQERVTVQAFYYWRNRVPKSTWQLGGTSSLSKRASRVESNARSDEHRESLSDKPIVRFTLRSGETTIQCESSSLESIELLLKWASSSRAAQPTVFQQLL